MVGADVVGRVLGSSKSSGVVGTGVGILVGESDGGLFVGADIVRVGVDGFFCYRGRRRMS